MRLSCLKISLVLLLSVASAGWCADYLYTPGPVTGEQSEGVLVREVTIKKGDTLSHLSKHYSGHGYYYPQILLFNEIKNPNRIRPGQIVKVPISRKAVQQTQAPDAQRLASVSAGVESRHRSAAEKKKPVVQAVAQGEKNIYNRASAAFTKGDCESAIKFYDAFISRYPSSAFLPEATLNRAECYLKLSGK